MIGAGRRPAPSWAQGPSRNEGKGDDHALPPEACFKIVSMRDFITAELRDSGFGEGSLRGTALEFKPLMLLLARVNEFISGREYHIPLYLRQEMRKGDCPSFTQKRSPENDIGYVGDDKHLWDLMEQILPLSMAELRCPDPRKVDTKNTGALGRYFHRFIVSNYAVHTHHGGNAPTFLEDANTLDPFLETALDKTLGGAGIDAFRHIIASARLGLHIKNQNSGRSMHWEDPSDIRNFQKQLDQAYQSVHPGGNFYHDLRYQLDRLEDMARDYLPRAQDESPTAYYREMLGPLRYGAKFGVRFGETIGFLRDRIENCNHRYSDPKRELLKSMYEWGRSIVTNFADQGLESIPHLTNQEVTTSADIIAAADDLESWLAEAQRLSQDGLAETNRIVKVYKDHQLRELFNYASGISGKFHPELRLCQDYTWLKAHLPEGMEDVDFNNLTKAQIIAMSAGARTDMLESFEGDTQEAAQLAFIGLLFEPYKIKISNAKGGDYFGPGLDVKDDVIARLNLLFTYLVSSDKDEGIEGVIENIADDLNFPLERPDGANFETFSQGGGNTVESVIRSRAVFWQKGLDGVLGDIRDMYSGIWDQKMIRQLRDTQARMFRFDADLKTTVQAQLQLDDQGAPEAPDEIEISLECLRQKMAYVDDDDLFCRNDTDEGAGLMHRRPKNTKDAHDYVREIQERALRKKIGASNTEDAWWTPNVALLLTEDKRWACRCLLTLQADAIAGRGQHDVLPADKYWQSWLKYNARIMERLFPGLEPQIKQHLKAMDPAPHLTQN